jgi:hypothetical protein
MSEVQDSMIIGRPFVNIGLRGLLRTMRVTSISIIVRGVTFDGNTSEICLDNQNISPVDVRLANPSPASLGGKTRDFDLLFLTCSTSAVSTLFELHLQDGPFLVEQGFRMFHSYFTDMEKTTFEGNCDNYEKMTNGALTSWTSFHCTHCLKTV